MCVMDVPDFPLPVPLSLSVPPAECVNCWPINGGLQQLLIEGLDVLELLRPWKFGEIFWVCVRQRLSSCRCNCSPTLSSSRFEKPAGSRTRAVISMCVCVCAQRACLQRLLGQDQENRHKTLGQGSTNCSLPGGTRYLCPDSSPPGNATHVFRDPAAEQNLHRTLAAGVPFAHPRLHSGNQNFLCALSCQYFLREATVCTSCNLAALGRQGEREREREREATQTKKRRAATKGRYIFL